MCMQITRDLNDEYLIISMISRYEQTEDMVIVEYFSDHNEQAFRQHLRICSLQIAKKSSDKKGALVTKQI